MKEHPILFNTEMVQAIQDKRKTMTRRVIKGIKPESELTKQGLISPNKDYYGAQFKQSHPGGWFTSVSSPYGKTGDLLFMRETWMIYDLMMKPELFNENDKEIWIFDGKPEECQKEHIIYKSDLNSPERFKGGWRSSNHMPRWASRINLEITDIRVERVQDISEEDANAEGIRECWQAQEGVDIFQDLWDSINAARGYGWDTNPWVWVVEFKVL